jgi:hypothetical protein
MKTPPLHLLVVGTILVLLMYLLLTEWFSEPQREHLATKCYDAGTALTKAKAIIVGRGVVAIDGSSGTEAVAKNACQKTNTCSGVLRFTMVPSGRVAYKAMSGPVVFQAVTPANTKQSISVGTFFRVAACPKPVTKPPVPGTTLPPKNLMRWLNGRGEWILYWEPPDVVNKYGFTIETSDGYKYQVPERTGSFHYYNLGQHTMGGVSFVLRMNFHGVVKSTLGFPVPTTVAAGDAKIKSWRAIHAPAPVVQSPPPTVLYASVSPKVTAKGGATQGSSTGNSEVLFWDNFSKRLLRVLDRWSHGGGSYDQVPLNTMPFQHPPHPAHPKPISNVSR